MQQEDYPTEETAPQPEAAAPEPSTNSRAAAPQPSSSSANEAQEGAVSEEELAQAKAELEAKRAAHRERMQRAMQESGFEGDALPSLEALREERAKLSETVRHHKDEQDALALDIENQEGASEVYHTAARVERFERFARAAAAYVEGDMPKDVDDAVEKDLKSSEDEIAAYIQELQQKREAALAKVSGSQKNAAAKAEEEEEPQLDEKTRETIEQVQANNDEALTLAEKIKKYRAMKTKLASEISREKSDHTKMETSLKNKIKSAELANARDERQCRELNNGNATLTSNANMLLNQLNVEHYGYNGAPSSKEVIEARKAREATPEATSERAREGSEASQTQQGNSRRQSVVSAKPPLVAMKKTEAQRSRDETIREEQEQSAARRASLDSSVQQRSRRGSITKPPLVASKPTEAQRIRDEATREELERKAQSTPSRRPRSQSITSDANRSTASQAGRDADEL